VTLTDPDALNIRVEPRYPEKPWAWDSATPYAIVPAAMLEAISGDWRGGNNPNGIYVYRKMPRAARSCASPASAGDVQLPGHGVITKMLLVDSGAQAQRGTQELAKAGKSSSASRSGAAVPGAGDAWPDSAASVARAHRRNRKHLSRPSHGDADSGHAQRQRDQRAPEHHDRAPSPELTMYNLFRDFLDQLPKAPLQVAQVITLQADGRTSIVQFPNGSQTVVLGQQVAASSYAFIRSGEIVSEAPAVTPVTIDV
jgi:hypothetical protein